MNEAQLTSKGHLRRGAPVLLFVKNRRATERFQLVLVRNTRDAQSKLFFLMFNDTLRRVGDYCTVKHWIGGAGTFGWISGFEDPTCHWSRNTSSLPPPPDQGQEAYS